MKAIPYFFCVACTTFVLFSRSCIMRAQAFKMAWQVLLYSTSYGPVLLFTPQHQHRLLRLYLPSVRGSTRLTVAP